MSRECRASVQLHCLKTGKQLCLVNVKVSGKQLGTPLVTYGIILGVEGKRVLPVNLAVLQLQVTHCKTRDRKLGILFLRGCRSLPVPERLMAVMQNCSVL